MKVIYPTLQKPIYIKDAKPWRPGDCPDLIKVGKSFMCVNSGAGNPPTSNDMAERSSDRRNVAITLPKLRYMND